ncbi:hypothetical protein HanXRQr2_Chr16g0775621 [Helianthus annuus]|uniref:Uncharacterized protein n=1 Tax=Helianthus annuus TaxID=4232 RepID=A0A251S3H7_HELAN|nr:hypothetical protein HanXRQr2_Chr16g0775621 [Helianthus annuus]KAJ0823461.1 hypothetical protein HanPSC8_Chr16g0744021 [Helianthus annuus]
MNKKVALLLLLLAVTAMVCRSDEEEKDASWTDWAKDKLSGAFNNDQLKSSAQDAKDAASGAADYAGEKAIEAEDAAASAAKELSEKPLV